MRQRGLVLTAAFMFGACLCPGQAGAGDSNTYWTALSGDWSDANNWTKGEPTENLNPVISNGGTATISHPGEICYFLYRDLSPVCNELYG